ncbi:MAG: 50S ribosomal protein L25/general stress protein Ctc [Gemmatimonadetes bacterium]|nr:MAG: 50S ribosomal protein L25/general stress protein Ctc [Gemmatimonadota bacterium]
MTMVAALSAERRGDTGKGVARKLRAAGKVPAVVYGKEQEPVPLAIDAHDALHLFQSISVENTIVNLDVDGETMETLVREIQMHPFRNDLIHVDFYRIQRGVALELDIPVHLVGTAEGVKTFGGLLEVVVHEVRARCIPSKIPESFELDISSLQIGDALHVADIEVPEGVEILTDADQTICTVVAPRVAEEEELEEGEEDFAEAGAEGAPEAEAEAASEDDGEA